VPHVACELVNRLAGVNIVHVPYRDVNSGLMATVSGVTQMFFGVSTNAKPQIDSGALHGLAVSSAQRSQLLPALPTMADSGFPEFVMPGWGGLIAPAGTPKPILDKLNLEVQRALERTEVQERLINAGMEPAPRYTPAQFRDFIASDIARWATFIDIIGLDKLQGVAQ
jgi:tripartite-type tricarboxylate transporter receptor subunit TctC